MKLNLTALLQLCFPYSQDEKIIASCTKDTFRSKLFPQTYKGCVTLASFKDPQVRSAIHLVKFHHNKLGSELLGTLLAAYFETLPQEQFTLIPMPISSARLRTRGHNQVTTIASVACKTFPCVTLRTDLLKRVRHSASQTSLSQQERRTNLTGAFQVPPEKVAQVRNAHVIVCDDVITTGSTMREAKKALAECEPASIVCVSLSH